MTSFKSFVSRFVNSLHSWSSARCSRTKDCISEIENVHGVVVEDDREEEEEAREGEPPPPVVVVAVVGVVVAVAEVGVEILGDVGELRPK